VAVHYRGSRQEALKTSAECAQLSGSSHVFQADLSDEAQVRALVPQVIAQMGRLDAVVNSASTFEHDSAETFGFDCMDKHFRANTGAPIVLAQALHAHTLARQGQTNSNAAADADADADEAGPLGVVVNLLDQKLWNLNPDFFSYTLSKAALETATTLLAMALSPQLRVVGVAPGLTLTSHLLTDAQFTARHKLSPLGRSSTPADVAATVTFALNNQSLTGTTILVDGGQHLMRFERDFSML
jgi:NAD(P)-dependent dehydrogenase (short-subunit alcohol dehydrogenase family)